MTLTATLFTGGLSRRMGTDKATLSFQGETLWMRQLRLLRGIEPDAICISARARPAWCPPEIQFVPDQPPSRGPLSGLAAVLGNLKTSHLLALAVDLPSMTVEHLRKLRTLARPGCGVVPVIGNRFEPLCAIYPIQAAPAARATLANGELSLQNLCALLLHERTIATYAIPESETALYRNANTPADLTHEPVD